MTNIVELGRHGQRGYYSLSDLPQRGSIAAQAFGTGWSELDRILKFYLGQFIVVTGIPSHGKSTFVLNVLCELARKHGTASFVYMPENEVHLRETLARIWRNDETFEHFCDTQFFAQSCQPEHYREEVHTLDWVLDQAVTAVRKDHVELVVIDPFNELEWAKRRDESMTDYIRDCLKKLKQFTRSMNVVTLLIAHPTKAIREDGGRIPGGYDIENSASWFNKADNGLTVFRVKDAQNVAQVISWKVREIGAGRTGHCFFNVNPGTGVFTPAEEPAHV